MKDEVKGKRRKAIEAIIKIAEEPGTQGYSLKVTGEILARFNMGPESLENEARDAIHSVVATLVNNVNNNKLVIPENVRNLESYLMASFKRFLTYYLLKRYARRCEKKPAAQFQAEIEIWEKNKDNPKPSRYLGNRFIHIDQHLETQDENLNETSSIPYSSIKFEDIEPLLFEKGLNEKDIQVIKLRTEGYDYSEIAEMTNGKVNALTQRYKRAIEKLGIDKALLQ